MKNNIKVEREKNNLTQKDCADIFGVTLRAWQTYEQGVSEPKYEMLCKIADYFNVSLDYLLGREPPSDPLATLGLTIHEISDDEFIRRYRNLPEDGRKLFLNVMRMLTEGAVIDTDDDGIPDGFGTVTLGELEDERKRKAAENEKGGKFA